MKVLKLSSILFAALFISFFIIVSPGAAQSGSAFSLDVDGNGEFDAMTDGILIIRYLAGFSGDTLIANAIGDSAARTTGDEVYNYLAGMASTGVFDPDGNGSADALTDGILIIRYMSGYSGDKLTKGVIGKKAVRTSASDIEGWLAFYKGQAVQLDIQAPVLEAPLASGVASKFKVRSRYSGKMSVAFHIMESPDGMSIDSRSGFITWTPPKTMEGSEANVKVSATDGEVFAEINFKVPVASPASLETQVQGNTITVTRAGNLNGLSLTLPSQFESEAGSPDQVKISKVSENDASPVPDGVKQMSDFFRVTPVKSENDYIEVAFPNYELPDGQYPFDLAIYIYENVSGVNDFAWNPSKNKMDVNDKGMITVKLRELGPICFIGLPGSADSKRSRRRADSQTFDVDGISITCKPKQWNLPQGAFVIPNHQICTVSGDTDFEAHIHDFNDNQWLPDATLGELVSWIYSSKKKAGQLDLSSDNKTDVKIHEMPSSAIVGYVNKTENYDVLHLSKNQQSKNNMKAATAHQFFLHALARTKTANLSNAMTDLDDTKKEWLTEGLAIWFEDYVFDDLNSYRKQQTGHLAQILKKGFDSAHDASDNEKSGPARFGMWKLISDRCSGFYLPDILNGDFSDDPTGINNLANKVRSPDWECDFCDGFGQENNDSLSSALLYYQYATIREKDVSLLESDEDKAGFSFITNADSFLPSVSGQTERLYSVPPNGAVSVMIDSVSSFDADEEVYLSFNVTGGDAWISIFSLEPDTDGPADTWFKVSQKTQHTYGNNSTSAPELFVTLVNPSSSTADVELAVGIREHIQGKLEVTKPAAGQAYNNRVIEVKGTIPDQFAGQVDRVLIKQPYVSGAENIASVNGNSFTGKAVIRLGSNSVTVVGLNSSGNEVTEPATVSFDGEENPFPTQRNALIKSNMVFVLGWDTDGTDIDMYVTDPLDRSIWFSNLAIINVGRQDDDDTNGYGPEVITFYTDGDAVEGYYEVSLHYYTDHHNNPPAATNYTVDVLLNEGSVGEIKGYRYVPEVPLTDDSCPAGPEDIPADSDGCWNVDVVRVHANGTGVNQVCALVQ